MNRLEVRRREVETLSSRTARVSSESTTIDERETTPAEAPPPASRAQFSQSPLRRAVVAALFTAVGVVVALRLPPS